MVALFCGSWRIVRRGVFFFHNKGTLPFLFIFILYIKLINVCFCHDRIKQEWDLAPINVLTVTACNPFVVWSLAPCRSYGNTFRFDLQNTLQKLPNNIFERSYPFRELESTPFFTRLQSCVWWDQLQKQCKVLCQNIWLVKRTGKHCCKTSFSFLFHLFVINKENLEDCSVYCLSQFNIC